MLCNRLCIADHLIPEAGARMLRYRRNAEPKGNEQMPDNNSKQAPRLQAGTVISCAAVVTM